MRSYRYPKQDQDDLDSKIRTPYVLRVSPLNHFAPKNKFRYALDIKTKDIYEGADRLTDEIRSQRHQKHLNRQFD